MLLDIRPPTTFEEEGQAFLKCHSRFFEEDPSYGPSPPVSGVWVETEATELSEQSGAQGPDTPFHLRAETTVRAPASAETLRQLEEVVGALQREVRALELRLSPGAGPPATQAASSLNAFAFCQPTLEVAVAVRLTIPLESCWLYRLVCHIGIPSLESFSENVS